MWLFGIKWLCLSPYFEYTRFTVPSSPILCSLRWKLIYIFPPSQSALRFIANKSNNSSHNFHSILYAYLKHQANATENNIQKNNQTNKCIFSFENIYFFFVGLDIFAEKNNLPSNHLMNLNYGNPK